MSFCSRVALQLGDDAVARLRSKSVLIYGLGDIGFEIGACGGKKRNRAYVRVVSLIARRFRTFRVDACAYMRARAVLCVIVLLVCVVLFAVVQRKLSC